MKKSKLFFLPLFFLLLASCSGGDNSGGQVRQPLGKPVLTINGEKNGLIWEEVEGAVSYSVSINDGGAISLDEPGYLFSSEIGNYAVSVTAVADDEQYNSEAASFTYETKAAVLGELSYESGKVSWASLIGLGVEAKFGDGGFVLVEDEYLSVQESGLYTLSAITGFDEEAKVFYVATADTTKTIDVDLREPLQMSELLFDSASDTIYWEEVEGAVSYSVVLNEAEPISVTTPTLDVPTEVGDYVLSVTAIADAEKYNSEPVQISFSVANASLGELSTNHGVIYWESFAGAGIQYQVNEGDFLNVDNGATELVVSENGFHTLRALSGFDADNSVYYVISDDEVVVRNIYASKSASELLVVENGDYETTADLMDAYLIEVYKGSGWEASTAQLALHDCNEGYTEGNCVEVQYWKNDNTFRYQKRDQFNFDGSYDTMSFTVKGNTDGKFSISLRIDNPDAELGGINLRGVTLKYSIYLPEKWTTYQIDLNDENWVINYAGSDISFEKIQTVFLAQGVVLNNVYDLLPFFTTVSLVCFCAHDANYSTTRCYLDDLYFANTNNGETKSEELTKKISLSEHYALKSDGLSGKMDLEDEGYVLSAKQDGETIELPVNLSVEENKVRMVCEEEGHEFDALLATEDGGDNMELESVTGSLQDALQGLKVSKYFVIDDFESYNGSGVGYDFSHRDSEARSGLRGAYFCDYYSGEGNSSIVGGNGWDLMKSTDYLDIEKNVVHSGTQSGRFKYNSSKQTRYSTYGLSDGTATKMGSGMYFSFWTKGVETRTNVIRVRVWSVNQVTPSNQSSESICEIYTFNIDPTAPWTECKISLNPAKAYYGFSIYPMKNNGTGQYFYVDDIYIYNSISPWGE